MPMAPPTCHLTSRSRRFGQPKDRLGTADAMDFIVTQFLTGLSGSASLFLMSAGLTVIFGVTRVINFAHGSLYMLGAYLGWSILNRLPHDPIWFMLGVVAAALVTALVGVALEITLLRRLYRVPELFQL